MRTPLLFLILLVTSFLSMGQAEQPTKSEFELSDGLFTARVGLTTELSERWTLHHTFTVSYNNDASRYSLPLLLRYKLTNQLSLYGGVSGYRVANTPSFNTIAPISKFGVGSLLGLELEFSKSIFFKAQLDANFSSDQNSKLMGLENNRSGGSFHFGYSF